MLALLALVGAASGTAIALASGPPATPLGAPLEYGFLNQEPLYCLVLQDNTLQQRRSL